MVPVSSGDDRIDITNNQANPIRVKGLWMNTTTSLRDNGTDIIRSLEGDSDGIPLRSGETTTIEQDVIDCTAGETVTLYKTIEYLDTANGATYNFSGQDASISVECAVSDSQTSGFSGWCYQETANESDDNDGGCLLDYTGSYQFTGDFTNTQNAIDANYSTGTGFPFLAEGSTGYLYANYTKPDGATNASKYFAIADPHNFNVSLEYFDTCWSQNPLMFRVYCIRASDQCLGYCPNGSDWEYMDASYINPSIYEEGMWWYIE